MPPASDKATGKRPAEQSPATNEEIKRLRSVIDETADEFVCALTYELPLDPVTAEDGKVYERSAIEEWLNKHEKSPITNEEMGTKLFPAHQVKNMIEKLVRSGAIAGDKAEAWQKRVKEQDKVNELRRDAEGGNTDAMYNLGLAYRRGEFGLAKDDSAAFQWSRRGAEARDARCMMTLAIRYLGSSVPGSSVPVPNPMMAMYWFTIAAEREFEDMRRYAHPSTLACICLGYLFAPTDTRSSGLKAVVHSSIRKLEGIEPSADMATSYFRRALPKVEHLIVVKSASTAMKQDQEFWERTKTVIEEWLRDHATDGNVASGSGSTA